ncbi:MAG: hypothetical protein ACJA08_001928 [Cyclobacteriaceae bacterium]|jgi:hypothetical protein
MLEYFKTVLSKVSFDRRLFEKELMKALKSLLKEEINVLRVWCYQEFGDQYQPVLNKCFSMTLV